MSDITITPTPTDEEAAAIAAALLLWPSAAPDELARDRSGMTDPRWRFSGRWWSRPVPMTRQRPWRG